MESREGQKRPKPSASAARPGTKRKHIKPLTSHVRKAQDNRDTTEDEKRKPRRIRINLPPPKSDILHRYAEGPLKLRRGKVNGQNFKRLKKTLVETEERIVSAATAAAVADDVLLTESAGYITADRAAGERTYRLKQRDMRPMLDSNSSRNIMDLYLTKFGPYRTSYSRNGRHGPLLLLLLRLCIFLYSLVLSKCIIFVSILILCILFDRFMVIAGERGHVATFDALRMSVGTELNLQETVHDAHYLHNETFFAVAQQKYT